MSQEVTVWSDTRGRGICRSCGARLTWARTTGKDKAMPFDGDPVALRTEHDPDSHRLIEVLDAADVHWRTCTDPTRFRKR